MPCTRKYSFRLRSCQSSWHSDTWRLLSVPKQTNEEKNDNGKYNTTFFMRRDYDADAQPNASGAQYNFKIKDADKWTKVVVYYDMGQVVNAISSKKANANLEVSDTDDDAAILKDCYVAILSQNKGGVVEISDVTLKKK